VFNSIGPMELIIVLVIVLVIFGPKRLPGLGKQLGSGMREFRESIAGKDHDDDDDDVVAPRGATTTRASADAALASAETDAAPLQGEVVRERAPR
jgi:sec-independent protein translocase protein TatA